VFVRGWGVGQTPLETIGNSKTEFNIILCTSKSEAAVTSNKKLRCRYDTSKTAKITCFILVLHWAMTFITVLDVL